MAGSFGTGRREINWDGVPDAFAAPNNLPANFFNVNSPRGVVFSTPGTGFQVSANVGNPTSTPIEFGNINATYTGLFAPFSAQRLFTALGSTITDVNFFFPGSNTPAIVTGFGAVFSDVDLATTTSIQLFDQNNVSLGTFFVPAFSGNETFSFLGISYSSAIISHVRITSGNTVPGANETVANDVVAMDDFIYGEPVGAQAIIRSISGATAAAITATRDQYRSDLGGGTIAGANGSFGGLRREINWDGVPDALAAPNNLPGNFFNVNSPRGVILSTPGTGLQVSANVGNPTSTPIEFGNINATYTGLFAPFSAQRLFTALGSTITDVTFFVPGTITPAFTKGFGSIFSDVDLAGVSSIEYFDINNISIGTYNVPNISGDKTESFLGLSYPTTVISRVRLISGNTALGGAINETASVDPVVMDDFIYGEPGSLVATCTPTAPQTFSNTTPVVIPTTVSVVTSTIVVSGAPTFLYDVNVLTNIVHTFNS
ncbi:MAG: hypothetical protein SGI83_05300, partial [Bacteroidota bacterium]|nr:hypothetical protein [Bacteroidota bacterium]